MLSDKEKKAIERLKNFGDSISCATYPPEAYIEMKEDIEDILYLIEKQSKELLEKIDNKYNQEEASEEMIPRYKIKAKIEEVEQWELYNMKIPKLSTLDERLGAKIGIKYVLQSLLEKE